MFSVVLQKCLEPSMKVFTATELGKVYHLQSKLPFSYWLVQSLSQTFKFEFLGSLG